MPGRWVVTGEEQGNEGEGGQAAGDEVRMPELHDHTSFTLSTVRMRNQPQMHDTFVVFLTSP
jgi:hypothetical protein